MKSAFQIDVYCVYISFLNLTKLVFFILPVARDVVHANRKQTLHCILTAHVSHPRTYSAVLNDPLKNVN